MDIRMVPMIERLFTSKVRTELLSTFFLHPDSALYVRELARITGEDYKNVSRELRNLEEIGLLRIRKQGNLKYFSLNREFLIYEELKSIFLKTRGAAAVLKDALSKMRGIDFAFIYGSLASGTENAESDIDMMVVGKIALERLLKSIRGPEGILGREINPSLFDPAEVKRRVKARDPFILEVLTGPKIMLIGDEDGLPRTA
jgi:predicted nucleotidyltransferase